MKISTIIEKDGNAYEFSAELSQEQLVFLLEYAVRDLIVKGLMPYAHEDVGHIPPPTNTLN